MQGLKQACFMISCNEFLVLGLYSYECTIQGHFTQRCLAFIESLALFFMSYIGGLAAEAQEPLTLRQAINEALGQSPEAAIARADQPGVPSRRRQWRAPSFCRNSTSLKTSRAATIRFMPSAPGCGSDSLRKPILR